MSPTPPATGSELVTYAARLVRVIRRETPDGTPATLRLLSQLDELGAATVTELARADNLAQPTMSAAVKQLEEGGLVSRQVNPADARSTLVALTEAGRERLAQARAGHAQVLERLVAEQGVSRADLDHAVAVLRALTRHTPSAPATDSPEREVP